MGSRSFHQHQLIVSLVSIFSPSRALSTFFVTNGYQYRQRVGTFACHLHPDYTLTKDMCTVCQHHCQAVVWCGISARLAKCLVLLTTFAKCLLKFISANDPPIFKNFCQSIHLILDVINLMLYYSKLRTFAKSLLNFISAASEGWRQVRCQAQQVRVPYVQINVKFNFVQFGG